MTEDGTVALTPRQVHVLRALLRANRNLGNPARSSQVAARCRLLSPQGVASILGWLGRKGLARHISSGGSNVWEITAQGREHASWPLVSLEEAGPSRPALEEAAWGVLDAWQRPDAHGYIQGLAEALAKLRDALGTDRP